MTRLTNLLFSKDILSTSYRVKRKDVLVPEPWIFPHVLYKGDDDERRVKVRLHTEPVPYVTKRVSPNERPFDPDDYQLRQVSPNKWVIEKKVGKADDSDLTSTDHR